MLVGTGLAAVRAAALRDAGSSLHMACVSTNDVVVVDRP